MKTQKNQQGLVRLIILIILALIILSYFGVDVKKILYSPIVVKIFTLIWNIIVYVVELLITLIRNSWGTIVSIFNLLVNFITSFKK